MSTSSESTQPASVATQRKASTDSGSLLIHRSASVLEDGDTPATPLPRVAKAGVASSIINLCNIILGSGILSVPYAFSRVGLVLGVVLLVLAGYLTWYGLKLLIYIGQRTSRIQTEEFGSPAASPNGDDEQQDESLLLSPDGEPSYSTITLATFPWLVTFVDIVIIVNSVGTFISYFTAIADLMPRFAEGFWTGLPKTSLLLTRDFWLTVSMLFLVPVSIPRNLEILTQLSLIALLSIFYLAFIVFYYFVDDGFPKPTWGELDMWNFSTSVSEVLPIFLFSFTCHQNIFPVYNELREGTRSTKIQRVVNWSVIASGVIYGLVGIFGYLSFGRKVDGDILNNYGDNAFVIFGRLAIAVLILFSFPLQTYPCRLSCGSIAKRYMRRSYTSLNIRDGLWSTWALANLDGILTISILFASYLVSLFVTRLDEVLELSGATGSTVICFVLPCMYFLKVTEGEQYMKRARFKVRVLLWVGIFFGVSAVLNMLVRL